MSRRLAITTYLIAVLTALPLHAQDELIEQWVFGIFARSSDVTTTIGGANQLFFEPEGSCELWEDEDYSATAWRPGTPDGGEEWIELRYEQPVFASAVEVYETLNPGAVTRVLVRDFEGQLHEVWAGTDPNDTCPAVLRVDFERLAFPINVVRVELNTALVPGFNQIDAVKLIGAPVTDFDPIFVRLDESVAGTAPTQDFDSRSAADLDNDGWPDIIARDSINGSIVGYQYIQHNEGDGTFHFRGPVLPIPDRLVDPAAIMTSGGPAAADYDNDGDLDLFYAVGDGIFGTPLQNLLLRNDRGTFVDVTTQAGLTAENISTQVIWLDYDRDGFVDLYVGNWTFLEGFEDQQNILYRNQGDGTFVDVTAEAGLDVQWHSPDSPLSGGTFFGFFAGDLNDDGWVDLYVVVAASANRLFYNDEGRFREATSDATRLVADSFGATAGDIDNDGDLDLFQASAFGTSGNAIREVLPERSTLFLNLGDEEFIDVTEGVGLQALNAANVFFGHFFDFDNDADIDLFFGDGLSSFYENLGDLFFVERPFQSGLPTTIVLADFDGDGFVDDTSFIGMFRNRGNDNHYLSIDLVGVTSNRSGIGATVFATTGDVRQRRDRMGGENGWIQQEGVVHFGLGAATAVDQLEIRWPSGQVDFIDNIPADQRIRVIEGRNEWYPAHRTVWETPPPEAVAFGQRLELDTVVRPELFEPTATITRIVADLSGLGGPDAVPLEDLGDGTYRLQADFTVGGEAPIRDVEVFIDQETSLGPYWTNLIRHVAVDGDPFTAILEEFSNVLPDDFVLDQNYPNPFNSGTVIRFALPQREEVKLAVYNLAGQQVAMLVQGVREAGTYSLHWDSRDDNGRALASGVYLYRLQIGEGQQVETRKLMLVR